MARRTVDPPRKRPKNLHQHRTRCLVCKHDRQVEIEIAYKKRVPLAAIEHEFGVPKASVETHARAFPKLEVARKRNTLGVLDLAIEEALDQIAGMAFKPQHITDLVLARAKLTGELVHLTADVSDRYSGWTNDQIEHYILTGEKPDDSHPPDCDKPGAMQDEPGRVQ